MAEPTENEILQMAAQILAQRHREREHFISSVIRQGVRKAQVTGRGNPLGRRIFGTDNELRARRKAEEEANDEAGK